MPSKSAKQKKLMQAVAHGWKPSRIKGPTRAVAREFVQADKREKGRGGMTGYRYGGHTDMKYYDGGGVEGYQYGGGVSPAISAAYRGIPPQRGGIMQGGGGTGGVVPPWMQQGGGGRGGALAQMMQRMQQQRGGLHPGAQGPGGGFLSRFAQQTPGQPLHPGARGPGGGMTSPSPTLNQRGMDAWRAAGREPPAHMMPHPGLQRPPGGSGPFVPGGGGLPPGIDPRAVAADPRGWARHQADPRYAAAQPGGGGRMGTLGGPGYGPNPLGSAGPGGDVRRRNQMAQNRFGALRQAGGPGGGIIGKPGRGMLPMGGGRQPPGRRIAPPPGKYPGGGNPMMGGRNPMMRGRGRYGSRFR